MSIKNDVVHATLHVIATDGFRAVTIRRVAAEVNRSTTVITHYFPNRDSLLREVVSAALDERRTSAESVIRKATDPAWAFLEWSIEADPDGVWPAVVAASAAGIEPEITEEARRFDEWWTLRLSQLLKGRPIRGADPSELANAIGVAVDGFIVGLSISGSTARDRRHLLHTLVDHLVPPNSSNSSTSPD